MSRLEAMQSLGINPLTVANTEAMVDNGTASKADHDALADANAMIEAILLGRDPFTALFYRVLRTADNPNLINAATEAA